VSPGRPFELQFFPTADQLADAAAKAFLDKAKSARDASRPYCVALSGGRIAENLFRAITALSSKDGIDLGGVHFFWADERCVPPDHADSNFRIAATLLFQPLKISPNAIHRIRGEDSPANAAASAEAEILNVVQDRATAPHPSNRKSLPVLDLVFLGLGEDGHTASLFPGESEEAVTSSAVYRHVSQSPKPPPDRITLGYSTLAAAREAWMLAAGGGKAGALRESLSPSGKTPFGRLLRLRSNTRIFTDIPADPPVR